MRLWWLQHISVNYVLSPQAVIVHDIVGQLLSYDERALHVHSVQQAIELFGPVHDVVGQLAAWSAVLLRSPKLAREGHLGDACSLAHSV